MLRITQEFMTEYVINPMAKRIADLEKLIEKSERKLNIVQQSLNYLKKYMEIKKKKKERTK